MQPFFSIFLKNYFNCKNSQYLRGFPVESVLYFACFAVTVELNFMRGDGKIFCLFLQMKVCKGTVFQWDSLVAVQANCVMSMSSTV